MDRSSNLTLPDKIIEEAPTKDRQRVLTEVYQWSRDVDFRRRILTAYDHTCAFCSIQLDLVDAAHIIPVNVAGSTDQTYNGVCLCPLHHRAYDKALVTFTPEYDIIHNDEKMVHLKAIGHDGGKATFLKNIMPYMKLPPDGRDCPPPKMVKAANKLRGWKL